MDVLCLTHQGKVPAPDCLRTFGLLGAEASLSTVQRGVPRPVTPSTHESGSDPTAPVSKPMVSAEEECRKTPVARYRANGHSREGNRQRGGNRQAPMCS